MIECDDTEPSIKSLAKVLLINFDTRYAPACSGTGKVKYYRKDTIGKYKRSNGMFLDPQVALLLGDMKTPDDYNMLKSNVIEMLNCSMKMLLNNLLHLQHLQPSPPRRIQSVHT